MAGLPKSGHWLVLALSLAMLFSCLAHAQVVAPLPSIDEQTPSDVLQPLADVLAQNAVATDVQAAELLAAFSATITAGQLTIEQALAMLALAAWPTLEEAVAVAESAAAIESILQSLSDGTLLDDPLVALALALGLATTPEGVRDAIARAGGSDELLAQVDELVSAGVPPGILVHLTKQSFHDGLDESAIVLYLDELAATADGDAWGQVVNVILDQGANQHRDREENANKSHGETQNEEEEEEANQHGDGAKKG